MGIGTPRRLSVCNVDGRGGGQVGGAGDVGDLGVKFPKQGVVRVYDLESG